MPYYKMMARQRLPGRPYKGPPGKGEDIMQRFIQDFLEDFRVRRQIRQESEFILKELRKEFRTLENSYRFRSQLARSYSPKQFLETFYDAFLSILTKYASMKNYSYKIGRNPRTADYFEVLNYYCYRVNEEAVRHIKAVKFGQIYEAGYPWTLPEESPEAPFPDGKVSEPETAGLLRLVEK